MERGISHLPWKPELVLNANTDIVHGGAITTLIDEAGGVACASRMGFDLVPREERTEENRAIGLATVDLRVDYMRPATPHKTVFCRAEVFHSTRRYMFVRATAFHADDDRIIASATSTYIAGAPTEPRAQQPIQAKSRANGTVTTSEQNPSAEPTASPDPRLQHFIDTSPFAQLMKVELTDSDTLGYKLPFLQQNVGNPVLGALHGGCLASFLEIGATFEMYRRYIDINDIAFPLPAGTRLPVPLNVTNVYLRSAQLHDCICRANVVKLGRTTSLVQASAWEDRSSPQRASGTLTAIFASP